MSSDHLEAEHARTGRDDEPCNKCRDNGAPFDARCRHCGWQSTMAPSIDVKTIDSDRAAFEDRAFYLRTLNGDNPQRDVYFARDNSVREYKDPVVAAMWWAWRESRIVMQQPEPFETNKWQEWANEAHRFRSVFVEDGPSLLDTVPANALVIDGDVRTDDVRIRAALAEGRPVFASGTVEFATTLSATDPRWMKAPILPGRLRKIVLAKAPITDTPTRAARLKP